MIPITWICFENLNFNDENLLGLKNDFASLENLNCNDENLLGQHIKDLLSETEIDYERNEDSEDDSYINEETVII